MTNGGRVNCEAPLHGHKGSCISPVHRCYGDHSTQRESTFPLERSFPFGDWYRPLTECWIGPEFNLPEYQGVLAELIGAA